MAPVFKCHECEMILLRLSRLRVGYNALNCFIGKCDISRWKPVASSEKNPISTINSASNQSLPRPLFHFSVFFAPARVLQVR